MEQDTLIKNFENEFLKCNINQQAAIQTIEGPVLVLAGPGTGKTQILSLRIANILLKTDALPSNILCLTYTDAARLAMRERLLSFIGSAAYQVEIHTFHSFSNKIIQENISFFSEQAGMQLISDLEEAELFEILQESFDAKHPLKKFTGDIYSKTHSLKKIFDEIKKENYSTSFLLAQCSKYIDVMPTLENFKYKMGYKAKDINGNPLAGTPNYNKINAETERIEKLQAAIKEFDRYQLLLKKYNRYDYNDMIAKVIKAFETNEYLLTKYQQQFLYILVDEFQDTNGAQSKIMYQLAAHWGKNPDLFVVGDDDQSVYSFQGAENTRMKVFIQTYAEYLKCIVLTHNYRSAQPILDLSSRVIENDKRSRLIHDPILKQLFKNYGYELKKDLVSALSTFQPDETSVRLLKFDNELCEITYIFDEILKKHKNGDDLSKIAIIYHNHVDAELLMSLFNEYKVPYSAKITTNLLDNTLIQNIIVLMKYINEASNISKNPNPLLFKLLFFEVFQIPPSETLLMAKHSHSSGVSFEEVVQNTAYHLKLGVTCSGQLQQVQHCIDKLIASHANDSLQVFFENLLMHTGIYQFALAHNQSASHIQALYVFFEFIKQESAKNKKLNLAQLLTMLDKMQTHEVILPYHNIVNQPQGVQLTTAHSSKGLEYEQVYLIRCNDKNWENKRSRSTSFSLFPVYYDSFYDEMFVEMDAEKILTNIEENRRLFYVACTRAKQKLTISWAMKKAGEKPEKELEASQFVAEAQSPDIQPTYIPVADSEIIKTAAILLKKPKPTIEVEKHSLMLQEVEKFKLSVTAMNRYLRCPIAFYFEHIVKVPVAQRAPMSFGAAIHKTLELYFKRMKSNNEFPPESVMIEIFEQEMAKHKEGFSENEYIRHLEYGNMILPQYLAERIHTWNKNVILEMSIQVEYQGVPLTGKIDKIEFVAGGVNVVDYKTGKPDPDKLRKNFYRPVSGDENEENHEKKYGGDYWRQLVFYKILLNTLDRPGYMMISGEMDYIPQNNAGKFISKKELITQEDIDIVTSQIVHVYQNIKNMNFATGCGSSDCDWCRFVSSNKLNINTDIDE